MRPENAERLRHDIAVEKALGEGLHTSAVRIPNTYERKMQIFAKHEGDNYSNLLREAMLIAIDIREQDTEYMAGLSIKARAELAAINDRGAAFLETALARAQQRRSALESND